MNVYDYYYIFHLIYYLFTIQIYYIMLKDYTGYWDSVKDQIGEISEDLKKLYLKMVSLVLGKFTKLEISPNGKIHQKFT